jgi:HK97 family phage portal protein
MIADALLSFLDPRAVNDSPTMPNPLDPWWYTNNPGRRASSGMNVTPELALTVSTVYACVGLLAETLAMLPLDVCLHHQEDDFNEPTINHPLWDVLHNQPNSWQTSYEWREMLVGHVALRGNSYNRIVPGETGAIDQLIPLNPDRMRPEQLPNKRLRYNYTDEHGKRIVYTQDEIFHVRGRVLNGVAGVGVIESARHAIGLSAAQETAGGKVFENGGVFLYALETEKRLGHEGRENVRKNWRGIHAGARNANNPPVLEDGLKIHELGLQLRDSQWIEGRKFQAEDICRFFRVPPHMVGILDRATLNNIEQLSMEFVQYCLLAWATRIETAGERDLLTEPDKYCIRFNFNSLLRGDRGARFNSYHTGLSDGFLTVNEARRLEGMRPIEGGDVLRTPLNMRAVNDQQAPAGDQQPAGEPEGEEGDGSGEPADEESGAGSKGRKAEEEKRRRGEEEKRRSAFAILLQDAAARIAAAEIRAIKPRLAKASDDPERFAAWLKEFYPEHYVYCTRVLSPIYAAWTEAGGRHFNLLGLVKTMPGLSPKETWETRRPGELASWLYVGFRGEGRVSLE